MSIFKYPYITITLFAVFILILGAIGIYFGHKAFKSADGAAETDGFVNSAKLETDFNKLGKLRKNRVIVYINFSFGNAASIYSESKVWNVFFRIKPLVSGSLGSFFEFAAVGEKNCIALASADESTAVSRISRCNDEITAALIKSGEFNLIKTNFGLYSAVASDISFDEAVRRAESASVIAKNSNTVYCVWNGTVGKKLESKLKIENSIKSEIDSNSFFLEYQPVVDAETKKIVGAEVLSRLNSKQDGIITPGKFMSALDSAALSDTFDYYIFEKNCKWISNRREVRERYNYAVNFSRTTLCDPCFAERIIGILDKYNISSSSVALEILEDKKINGEAKERIIDNLKKIRSKGIPVLLDDFGGGYTSFDDLQNLEIDIVKIDSSITKNVNTQAGRLIFKNVVRTAKDLGLRVICEGIETAEQEAAAVDAGCDMLQGFYYFRPMSVTCLEELFEKNEV